MTHRTTRRISSKIETPARADLGTSTYFLPPDWPARAPPGLSSPRAERSNDAQDETAFPPPPAPTPRRATHPRLPPPPPPPCNNSSGELSPAAMAADGPTRQQVALLVSACQHPDASQAEL